MGKALQEADPANVIRGRFRPRHALLLVAVASLLQIVIRIEPPHAIYQHLGAWLQQHLCVAGLGGYSVTVLILASAVGIPLLALIVGGGFWIRRGVHMVREKTTNLPGRKPLFDTALIDGSAAVRGGWMEVAAGAFVMLACAFIPLGPVLGLDGNAFLRHPAEIPVCKASVESPGGAHG